MAVIVLTAAVLLGGGSHAGFPGDVATQFLALPLFVLSVRAWSVRMSAVRHRTAETVLSAAILAVPVLLAIQLVSWPGWLRAAWIEGLPVSFLLQEGDAAQPSASALSVSPAATWAAAVSLIPFFALFFGISRLDEEERLKLARLILTLMALALSVGFLQHLQGASSSLRFYAITNNSSPVGFFANRNHFAAQLYTGLIFASVWFGFSSNTLSRSRKTNSRGILWFAGLASLIAAVLCAIMVAQSRAGLILAVAAIGGIAAIFIAERRETGDSLARGKLILACLVFGALFAAQFGVSHVLMRFEGDPLSDLRVKFTSATFILAVESLPFGTGLGTFAQVYATTEKTEDLFDAYVNRAHNDWAELFLETGLPGAVAAGLFLIWFGWRAWLIWRRTPTSRHINRHLTLQRAATLVIALLLAHSLVDYPLRTTAMASIFAFACAIMVNPPARRLVKG